MVSWDRQSFQGNLAAGENQTELGADTSCANRAKTGEQCRAQTPPRHGEGGFGVGSGRKDLKDLLRSSAGEIPASGSVFAVMSLG